MVITFWGMSIHLWLRLFFLVLLFEDGRGGHLLLLLLLLEGHRGVGGLRVGHVVLDDHLVVDGIVGRGGLSVRRGAPAPAAAATPAALWALGAAVGGFKDSWVSGCGLWGRGGRGGEREEKSEYRVPVKKLKLVHTGHNTVMISLN